MKLLILDGPRDPRTAICHSYRGTYRAHPTYCSAYGDQDEINRLFFWFLNEGGELGIVRNLRYALRFAELWNAHLADPRRYFEVIEVTENANLPHTGSEFLGFDLSASCNNSLISRGLKPVSEANEFPAVLRVSYESLVQEYGPKINNNGLFDSFDAASACLQSLAGLQDRSPNLFEGGDLRTFQVTGLYHVSEQNGGNW